MCIVHCTSMTSGTIVSATTMDMTEKIGITLPKSIIQKIERFRAKKRILQKCSKPAGASKGYRNITDGKGARK